MPLRVVEGAEPRAEPAHDIVEARLGLRHRVVPRLPRIVDDLRPADVVDGEAAPGAAGGEARFALALVLEGEDFPPRALEADRERCHLAPLPFGEHCDATTFFDRFPESLEYRHGSVLEQTTLPPHCLFRSK